MAFFIGIRSGHKCDFQSHDLADLINIYLRENDIKAAVGVKRQGRNVLL